LSNFSKDKTAEEKLLNKMRFARFCYRRPKLQSNFLTFGKSFSPAPSLQKLTLGSAYVLVVVASLLILTLVLTTLTVTAASRRITARYEEIFSLYDLAVAGNEQAFYLMQRGELAMHFNFNPAYGHFRHTWRLYAGFGDLPEDIFAGRTTVSARVGGGYYIETRVTKHIRGVSGLSATVRSQVKILDGNALEMVELLRITD